MQKKIGGGLDREMILPFLTMLLAMTLWGVALWALAAAIRNLSTSEEPEEMS